MGSIRTVFGDFRRIWGGQGWAEEPPEARGLGNLPAHCVSGSFCPVSKLQTKMTTITQSRLVFRVPSLGSRMGESRPTLAPSSAACSLQRVQVPLRPSQQTPEGLTAPAPATPAGWERLEHGGQGHPRGILCPRTWARPLLSAATAPDGNETLQKVSLAPAQSPHPSP